MATKLEDKKKSAKLSMVNAALKIESAKLKLQRVPTLTGYIADSSKTKGTTSPDGKT